MSYERTSQSSPKRDLRPPKPLSPPEIFDGFRDLGAERPLSLSPALGCDPTFNRYSAYWVLGPTLDSTYSALDGLRLTSPVDSVKLVEAQRDTLASFFYTHFDGQIFATDSGPRTRGIFAALAAINLSKSLLGLTSGPLTIGRARALGVSQSIIKLTDGPPLTVQKFRVLMEEGSAGYNAGRAAVKGIDDLVAECRDKADEGIIDNPLIPLIPTLTDLSTASSVLWNLWPDDAIGLLRYYPRRSLERFISGCIQRQRDGDRRIAGFSIHPDIDQPSVDTTFFGLLLMRRLRMSLDHETICEIEAFLCRAYKEGGFSSTLDEPRSLNATFFGFRALEILGSRLFRQLRTQQSDVVAGFVYSCWRPATRGFAFAAEVSRYLENCLASRYALQVLTLMGKSVPEGTRDFFLRQFDPRPGGFLAYPKDSIKADRRNASEVEAYFDRKDEELHRSFLKHAQGNVDDREWRLIEELYDRLAELEEGSNAGMSDQSTEVAELGKRIESLQQRRARRLRADFQEEVLRPLNASVPAIERARRLLST